MMCSALPYKYKILNRKYSTNNVMLTIDAFIEHKENGYLSEIILLEIHRYIEKKKVTMLLDVFTLRALSIALQKSVNGLDTPFKNFTESKGEKKTLSLNVSESKVFLSLDSKSPSVTTKVAYVFGFIGAESFAVEIEDICSYTNRELFNAQKEVYSQRRGK